MPSFVDLNDLAEKYYFTEDPGDKAVLRDHLWEQSLEYVQFELGRAPKVFTRKGLGVADLVGEAMLHMPSWMALYKPPDKFTTYLSGNIQGMKQNANREPGFNHRFHEVAIQILNLVRGGMSEVDAFASTLVGHSAHAQEQIKDCYYQITTQTISTDIVLNESAPNLKIETLLADPHQEKEFSAVINRVSRPPMVRKLHKKHQLLIDQLMDRVPFRLLDFGERLTLAEKAIRLSEALERLYEQVHKPTPPAKAMPNVPL